MRTIEDILDELAERVAERVLERLGTDRPVLYTTSKRGPHFPGKSRDWTRRHIRDMPGARKVGQHWEISREDYERWAAARDEERSRPKPPKPPESTTDLARRYLRESGRRSTKKGEAA